MATLQLDTSNSLYYEHHAVEGKPTVVFVNALTGSTDHWEQVVAPACRDAGFGTLSYNMRGQVNTELGPDAVPDCDLIVADLQHLLRELSPHQPVLCGLSIGGLFAAKAALAGSDVKALILLNTLREIGPRLQWMNEGMMHVLDTGGFPLMLDMYLPLLTGENFHEAKRADHLKGAGYTAEDKNTGAYRLMKAAVKTDWDINYEKLGMPVLGIFGLQDRVFYDAAVVEKLAQRMPDYRQVDWQNAGHLLPLEVPEQLASAVVDFVSGL